MFIISQFIWSLHNGTAGNLLAQLRGNYVGLRSRQKQNHSFEKKQSSIEC